MKPSSSSHFSTLAAWALAFGCAVGWDAVVLPWTTFLPKAGPLGTLLGLLAAGCVMAVIAWNFHYMGNHKPGPGGVYAYATAAFGHDHGYLCAWFLCLTYAAIVWLDAAALPIVVRYVFGGDSLRFGFSYTVEGFEVCLGDILLVVAAAAIVIAICVRRRVSMAVQTVLAVVFAAAFVACFVAAAICHDGGLETMKPLFSPQGGGVFSQLLGVLMMARRIAPELELHVSTQAGVTNYAAANALYELGARRVVLAREMDLQAVRDIRANIPDDLDIETFVHGSMCMAFSGRCLISNYLTGRDGNHGECAQPCRWKYSLVEEKRPGQVFPIEETAQGTYLFNSQDMNMMEHLDDLIDSGATSLKIEGRSKSAYYVAAMTNAYKSAVNEYMVQRGFEDAEGNELKPFRDRVIRAGEEGTEDDGPDSVTLHADEAFAGMPNWDSAVDEGELSNRQARRTGLERQAEYAEDAGWKHAGVHPAPPVELPDWLREEPGKVAHRDYSTGFYYPEQKVTQNTDRSAYFRDWLVVGEALEWTPEDGGRLTIMSRNKIEPGQLVEILLPGEAPLQYVVPAQRGAALTHQAPHAQGRMTPARSEHARAPVERLQWAV